MIAKVFYTRDLIAGYLGTSINVEDYIFATSLEADNPDNVFGKLNRGSGVEDWDALKGKRSMSVGDIVIMQGRAYYCEPEGWREVPNLIKHLLELEGRSELQRCAE